MDIKVPVVTVKGPASPQGAPILTSTSTHTPMIMTTDSYGNQFFTPLGLQPLILSGPVMWPQYGMDGMPLMMVNGSSTSSPNPYLPTPTPSLSPLPAADNFNIGYNSLDSLALPPVVTDLDSKFSSDCAEPFIPSRSRDVDAHILGDIEPFFSERCQPIQNENNVPVPKFDDSMTKKDLVNKTLDWMYEVCGGSHFDCEGRRGENVLRIKVKTRGALEYICPFVNQCIEEGLLQNLSCPISKKRQRRYVRGFLAYLEATDEKSADRIVEIFNEINTVYVKNAEGQSEHPFKGISRNPVPVRERTIMPQLGA